LPGRKAGMAHGLQRRDMGHGHRGHGPRRGMTDDGWPVLATGLGRRRKLKGASGHAPGRVSGRGDHPSGMPMARGRSLG
jgi:hypothetical protein